MIFIIFNFVEFIMLFAGFLRIPGDHRFYVFVLLFRLLTTCFPYITLNLNQSKQLRHSPRRKTLHCFENLFFLWQLYLRHHKIIGDWRHNVKCVVLCVVLLNCLSFPFHKLTSSNRIYKHITKLWWAYRIDLVLFVRLSPTDPYLAKRRTANHPCPVCGKHYVNEGSLRKHLACHPETSQLTTSLRMWPCSVCQAVFTHEGGKVYNYNTVTGTSFS